jgi:phosphatidylinositol glycan class B
LTISIKNRLLFIGSVAFAYIYSAVYSSGFLHPDEYFQIFEYYLSSTGSFNAENLAWEYHAQIRSWFQPWLIKLLFFVPKLFGDISPLNELLILRIYSAIFSVFLIIYLMHSTSYSGERIYLYFAFSFLFFYPLLKVRYSSENWSSLFLLFSYILIFNQKNNKNFFIFGVLHGIAFLCRYQSIFFSIGSGIYFLIKKEKIYYSVIGGITILIFGVIIDSYYYGQFVIAPYNYFFENILNNKAAEWGVSPWYSYPEVISRSFFYLGGGILLISILIKSLTNLNEVSLGVIIFFIAHSFVGHKEARFMIPLFEIAPLLLLKEKDEYYNNILGKKIIYTIILINVLYFFSFLGRRASEQVFLISHIEQQNRNLLVYNSEYNPITYSRELKYLHSDIKAIRVEEYNPKIHKHFIYYSENEWGNYAKIFDIKCEKIYENGWEFNLLMSFGISPILIKKLSKGYTVKLIEKCG